MNKDTVYRAGQKQFNPKTEKDEFIPFEQILKPQTEEVPRISSEKCFLPTQKGLIKHSTLLSNGFTEKMIADLIERGVLHLPKVRQA